MSIVLYTALTDLEMSPGVEVHEGLDYFWGWSAVEAIRFLHRRKPDVIVLQWWSGTVLHSYLLLTEVARAWGSALPYEYADPGAGVPVRERGDRQDERGEPDDPVAHRPDASGRRWTAVAPHIRLHGLRRRIVEEVAAFHSGQYGSDSGRRSDHRASQAQQRRGASSRRLSA